MLRHCFASRPPQTEEGRRRNRALLELDGEWQSPVREYYLGEEFAGRASTGSGKGLEWF